MYLKNTSDRAILKELGGRIARHRLNRNMTQAALAVEAGISKPTLQRMESGVAAQVVSLVRVLRALQMLENFDAAIPDLPPSPVQQLKLHGKQRRRASSVSEPRGEGKWSWGDET